MRKLTQREIIIDKYAKAAVNLYGFVTPRHFLTMFNRYNKPKLLKAELLSSSTKLNSLLNGYYIYDNAIVNMRVKDERMRQIIYYQNGKKYYMPTPEEIEKYAYENYYQPTKYTTDLKSLLINKFNMNMFTVESYMAKLNFMIKTEETNQIMMNLLEEYGVKFYDEKLLQEYIDRLILVINNTKKWANCGYSPEEFREKFVGEI